MKRASNDLQQWIVLDCLCKMQHLKTCDCSFIRYQKVFLKKEGLSSQHGVEQAWASAHACHDSKVFNAQGEAASEAKLPRLQISAHAAIGHSHARFAMHSQNKPKHTARAAWQFLLLLLGNVDT